MKLSRIAAGCWAFGPEHWDHRLRRSLAKVCRNHRDPGWNHKHRNGSPKVVRQDGNLIVETNRGAFAARNVINCAGLHSDRVSRMAGLGAGSQDRTFPRGVLRSGSSARTPGANTHLSRAGSKVSVSRRAFYPPRSRAALTPGRMPCWRSNERVTSAPISTCGILPEP